MNNIILSNYLSDEEVLHSKRVQKLALELSTYMGYSAEDSIRIGILALYHDLGKSQVPSRILTKKGKLTEMEFEVIKKHTLSSKKLLLKHDFPLDHADIVFHHHENVDGSGYPMGLEENEIPIESQIISICDYVDARTSVRVYRDSVMTELEMSKHLLELIDKKFRRDVSETMISLLEENLDFNQSLLKTNEKCM